jgi:repressor LexA
MDAVLTGKRREILAFIAAEVRERGFPPSVREIAEAVGLASSSTVHSHLQILQRDGYLVRDPTKPRAIVVHFEPSSGAAIRLATAAHVPLVGDVAAGVGVLAEENVEEVLPLPESFTGQGELFMLVVRGESMIEAGVLDGDYVVVRHQLDAESGEMVVAGIPGGEATVKILQKSGSKIVLEPRNPRFETMEFDPGEVVIYGKVVTVLRRV